MAEPAGPDGPTHAPPSPSPSPLRILVTDGIISRFQAELTSDGGDGNTWTTAVDLRPAEVCDLLPETDVLVCQAGGMTAGMARAGSGLRLVQVTGAGCDGIPFGSLAPGTAVANTYHHGRSLAEHVLMCLMMLSRRVLTADRELRSGLWRTVATDPGTTSFGTTLEGRTLGLIGLGETGAATARLASALGMRVQAVRANPDAPPPPGVELDWTSGVGELRRLMASSDAVVVGAPLTEDTRGLVGAEELRAMKPTAFLINVARGPVVDEDAAFAALSSGAIAGAALDVWWDAPAHGDGRAIPSRHPFEKLDNVVLTPHNSGHTRDTFEGRAREIAENIGRLARGRPLLNVVRAATT